MNDPVYVPLGPDGQPIQPGAPAAPIAPAPPAAPVIYDKEIQITQIGQPRIVSYIDKRTQQPKNFTVYEIFGNDGIKYEVSSEDWMKDKKVGDMVKIKFKVITNAGANGQVYTNYRVVLPSIPERVTKLEKQIDAFLQGKTIPTDTEPTAPVAPVAPIAPVAAAPIAPVAPIAAPVAPIAAPTAAVPTVPEIGLNPDGSPIGPGDKVPGTEEVKVDNPPANMPF